MSIENIGGDERNNLPGDNVGNLFGIRNGLYEEVYNAWLELNAYRHYPHLLGRLSPIEHYRDRLIKHYNPTACNFLMGSSNPDAICAYDRLVDEFNADLERIKREKDFDALAKFRDRAKKLFYLG